MLNSSMMHNLSTGAERVKSILIENGENGLDGFDDDDDDGPTSQSILNENNNESTDLSSLDCSYVDLPLLEGKLKLLNVYMDKLTNVNSRITKERNDLINEKLTFQTRMSQLLKEKDKLEIQLKDSKRTVDLLQEELNDKHLQLSALKTRLDGTSCLDINQLKSSISDLKRSLTVEQEKSEQLTSKVDGLQLAVEERNNRISQLINELHQVEADKASLGIKVQELSREKQFLIEEKIKLESSIEDMAMDREIESEEARLRLQDSAKANKLIPQLMQLVIRDKNDEITELQNQLEDIKDKLNLVLPVSHDLTDPLAMVDELINHYLILKDKNDVQQQQQQQQMKSQMYPQNSNLSGSPRSLNGDQHITSTINKSFGSNGSRIHQDDHRLAIKNSDLEDQLCELQLKYDKIYFTMNNLREENEILKHELEAFRDKRNLPFSRDLTDPITMVDELIDQYLILKDKIDSQLTMKSQEFHQNSIDSPRSSITEPMISSTNRSFGFNGFRVQQDDHHSAIKNNELENQLCELQLKYDKLYFTTNNLREENEILKHEVEAFREEKNQRLGLSLPVDSDNSVNGCGSMDKDSDFIDEKDSVEEALIKIHEQSAELLILSESTKRSQDTVVKAIIELIPVIFFDENNGNHQCNGDNEDDGDNHVIGGEFSDLSSCYGSCNIFSSDRMDSFLNKFASRDLGIKLLDKMLEIKKFYLEACEKIKYYVTQNETISGQLSSVEDALIKVQSKLDSYQKKYEKVKRKLKDRSNEMISQANNKNKDEEDHLHNLQSNENPMNKVKVDHCHHDELHYQYRRCLSHRNSLIYQKRFLLNVLGGYKLTEEATLALLANVKVLTEESPLPISDRKRFKSVVIALIALRRINHIRLKHSSYPKRINPQFVSSSQPSLKVIVPLSSAFPSDLSPHPSPSSSSSSSSLLLTAPIQLTVPVTRDEVAPEKCFQNSATIKEYVNRLQRLHRTLGLEYETRYGSADS